MELNSVIGGYKIVEKIGEGGMGTVFRGIDVMLEREVALKLLRPELTHMPDLVKRFHSEAIALARLNHPHIVTLHQLFRDGDRYFMVLEFVRGETLDHLIKRCSPIPWRTACPLICQALAGLEHAHILKVIHRDIKPANLILTQTGIVKLMDFGIARMLESGDLTQVGNMIGTLKYMSPEQIQGQDIDHLSDLYAVGAVLYEMLTGHAPFDTKTDYELIRAKVEEDPKPLRAFAHDIPPRLEDAVLRALAKSAQERFQSAGKFRAELEAILKDAASDHDIDHAEGFDSGVSVLGLMTATGDAGEGRAATKGRDQKRDKTSVDDDRTVIMERRYPKVIIPRPGYNKTFVSEAAVDAITSSSGNAAQPQDEVVENISTQIGRFTHKLFKFEPRVRLALMCLLPVVATAYWASSTLLATPDQEQTALSESFQRVESNPLAAPPRVVNPVVSGLQSDGSGFQRAGVMMEGGTVAAEEAPKTHEPIAAINSAEGMAPPPSSTAAAQLSEPVTKPVKTAIKKKTKPRSSATPSRPNNLDGGWTIVTN
jgi:serine/threonine protein kinase